MSERKLLVPHFEPEVVQAEAKKKFFGDIEKVATTSMSHLNIHGVSLTSRYNKAHEFEAMAAIVEAVSPNLRSLIDSIWCDSKANACYSVNLKHCTRGQARAIAKALDEACLACDNGHNGIFIEGATKASLHVDPNWMIDVHDVE